MNKNMFDPEEFKDTFTALARELKEGVKIPVKEIPSIIQSLEDKPLFSDYNPGVIDFLQRCHDESEGEEIILFLFKRGEITLEEKEALLKQLKEKGIRSFGPLRKEGYYDRQEKLKRVSSSKKHQSDSDLNATRNKEQKD